MAMCFNGAGSFAKGDYMRIEILRSSIQIWPPPSMLGSVLLSPHKMKLLLLVIFAAFGVCVNARWLTLGLNNPIQGLTNLDWRRTKDESSSGRRAACDDCECDCQYFSGGCRVGKILQNTACYTATLICLLLFCQ